MGMDEDMCPVHEMQRRNSTPADPSVQSRAEVAVALLLLLAGAAILGWIAKVMIDVAGC